MITALLLRASELIDGNAPAEQPSWGAAFDAMYPLVTSHLQALKVSHMLLSGHDNTLKDVTAEHAAELTPAAELR